MKKLLTLAIIPIISFFLVSCVGFTPGPGTAKVATEQGYDNAFQAAEAAQPLQKAEVKTSTAPAETTSPDTMKPVSRNKLKAALKEKLKVGNGKSKQPTTLEAVAKMARENRAWLIRHDKAIKELSLMVILNRYMIKYGKGAIIPLRYFFGSGSTVLSKTAKKDLDLLCKLSKEDKIKVLLIEGYSDDTGAFDKNAVFAWNRAETAEARLKCGECKDLDVLTTAYAESNFQGSKRNNRSVIVYVEVIEAVDASQFGGNTVPAVIKADPGPKVKKAEVCK